MATGVRATLSRANELQIELESTAAALGQAQVDVRNRDEDVSLNSFLLVAVVLPNLFPPRFPPTAATCFAAAHVLTPPKH